MRDTLATHAHDMSIVDLRDVDGVTAPTSGQVLVWDATRRLYVPGQVASAGIADGAVGTDQLADEAVTTAKIDDGAVTYGKLAWREQRLNDVAIAGGITVGQAVATAITLNFTTTQPNAILHCGFQVDANTTVANAGNFANIYSRLDGGADVFTKLFFSMAVVTRFVAWKGLSLSIPTPGAHTLDMRHNKNGIGGTFVNDANSLISDIILFG